MIKNTLLLCLLVLAPALLFSQSGISFKHEKWNDILKQAKQDDKLIFVDAYTTWCGPCKWMSANVFPEQEVGDFYNDHFINVKLDMEKGEGITFAQKYGVRSYPTFLFIDGDGELMHRSSGSRSSEDFIDLARVANDPMRNQSGIQNLYNKAKNPDAKLTYDYAMSTYLSGQDEAARKATLRLLKLKGKEKWAEPKTADLMIKVFSGNPPQEIFEFVKENRLVLYKPLEKRDVDNFLLFQLEGPYRDLENTPDVDGLLTAYKGVYSDDEAEAFANEFLVKLFLSSKAPDAEFYDILTKRMKKGYQDQEWSLLNAMAWSFFENTENKKYLKQALKWALHSVSLNENFYNTDTAAALYHKLGNNKKAEPLAIRAIDLAKEDGMDPEGTQELLKKIRQ